MHKRQLRTSLALPSKLLTMRLTRPNSGSGNGVAAEVLVDVEEDAGVISSVERGSGGSAGGGRAAASDLEVDALGVGLGAVGVTSGVEGEDLVAENVVAGGEAGGDLDGPGVAVGDELVGGPGARVGAGHEAGLGNLGELERGLVDGGKVTRDGGNVVNDGALVALRPGVPLESDGATSGNNSSVGSGSSTLVADDVGGTESGRLNEAVVLVLGRPANGVRGSTVGDSAAVLSAVGDDGLNVAVSLDGRGHGNGGDGSSFEHLEYCYGREWLVCVWYCKAKVVGWDKIGNKKLPEQMQRVLYRSFLPTPWECMKARSLIYLR
jgi:hypothetical protein